MVGHDLRQPLTVIVGTLVSLADKVDGPARRIVARAELAAARMTEAIDSAPATCWAMPWPFVPFPGRDRAFRSSFRWRRRRRWSRIIERRNPAHHKAPSPNALSGTASEAAQPPRRTRARRKRQRTSAGRADRSFPPILSRR